MFWWADPRNNYKLCRTRLTISACSRRDPHDNLSLPDSIWEFNSIRNEESTAGGTEESGDSVKDKDFRGGMHGFIETGGWVGAQNWRDRV